MAPHICTLSWACTDFKCIKLSSQFNLSVFLFIFPAWRPVISPAFSTLFLFPYPFLSLSWFCPPPACCWRICYYFYFKSLRPTAAFLPSLNYRLGFLSFIWFDSIPVCLYIALITAQFWYRYWKGV